MTEGNADCWDSPKTGTLNRDTEDVSTQTDAIMYAHCNMQTDAASLVTVGTDIDGLSERCLEINNREVVISLQQQLRVIKGLSRKHVPFKSFLALDAEDNATQERKPRQGGRSSSSRSPSSRYQSDSEKGTSTGDKESKHLILT